MNIVRTLPVSVEGHYTGNVSLRVDAAILTKEIDDGANSIIFESP